jgi:hypothetical protein
VAHYFKPTSTFDQQQTNHIATIMMAAKVAPVEDESMLAAVSSPPALSESNPTNQENQNHDINHDDAPEDEASNVAFAWQSPDDNITFWERFRFLYPSLLFLAVYGFIFPTQMVIYFIFSLLACRRKGAALKIAREELDQALRKLHETARKNKLLTTDHDGSA